MKRVLFALVAAVFVTAPAFADQALATSKNCMACHAVDKKLVGPSYKDVAKKYAGQMGAADQLAAKIINGGSGVWGPVPMPPNKQVNEADAKKLAVWVLSLLAGGVYADSDRVFNWAQHALPQYLSPNATTQLLSGYYYRYYSSSASYLAVVESTRELLYLGPLSDNTLLNLGQLADWLVQAQSDGF